jgi:outer membrane protein insertion porin family
MNHLWKTVRSLCAVAMVAVAPFAAPLAGGAALVAVTTQAAEAAIVNRIEVRGNSRMDADTIRTYLTIEPGKSFSSQDIDDSVKSLFGTGLFADVSIYQSGSTLIVEVDESGIVNEVFFEGNKRLKDNVLATTVQTQSRSTYSQERVASDVERIREAYSRVGREDASVTYEIVPLANKRVNVVYRIDEGDKTKIATIDFIGNNAYGAARLRGILETKPTNFFSWLRNDDIYDSDKLRTDEERLRRFYYNNGYADFQVLSTDVNFDATGNRYVITFTVDEGARYTFGNVSIDSTVAEVSPDSLYPLLETSPGAHYSADDVEKTIIALTEAVAERGYAFVQVVPRGNRNFSDNTIDVVYLVDQGPRVYIERINIVGNDRTRDHVIRREFDISEGDALNQVMIQKTKRRLEATGFFESVDITTRPGSSPDRVIVAVRVIDKATGEFSIGGGYSTATGALGEISFTEKNFLGRGQYLRVAGGFGEDERRYSLSFTEPYFLGYRMSAGFDIEASTQDATENRQYGVDSVGGTLRLGIPLTEKLNSQVFYSYSREDITIAENRLDFDKQPRTGCQSLGPGETPGNTRPINRNCIQGDHRNELSAALAPPVAPTEWTKSGFGYQLTYNDLDNPRDPREGIYLNLRQDFYGAGGDASYMRTEGTAVLYATLVEEVDMVGMLRGRAGANTIFDDTGYRALDNFFQGSRAIRGFENYGFGPRDPITGDALGGMYYWNATAELTFPMPGLPESMGIRGGVFIDAGQLWGLDTNSRAAVLSNRPNARSIDDNTIRSSVGGSVIWASPFGPLRFDYAVPISQAPWDRTREFNFGVSTTF